MIFFCFLIIIRYIRRPFSLYKRMKNGRLKNDGAVINCVKQFCLQQEKTWSKNQKNIFSKLTCFLLDLFYFAMLSFY